MYIGTEEEKIKCYRPNCTEEATLELVWKDEHLVHFVWENTALHCLGFFCGCTKHSLKVYNYLRFLGKQNVQFLGR